MSGLPGNPVTDPNGDYTASVAYNWGGTVTPSKQEYTLVPVSRTYVTVTADQLNENYTATSDYDLDGSGLIDWPDIKVIGDNWLTAGPSGDVDGSNFVDLDDYAEVTARWMTR